MLDLDSDLGDASEVYDIEPVVETGFVLRGDLFDTCVEDVPATWRVDEVCDGRVRVHVSWSEDGRRSSTGAQFGPEAAREFGLALLRAADYADRQREECL